jgi:transposase
MDKHYQPYCADQVFLMPLSMRDWLPEDHLVYFVSDLVDTLDLSGLFTYKGDGRGAPPFHPAMMAKIILYGLCRGVFSSRKLARAVIDEIPFRILAAGYTPDFRTINMFRKRRLKALAALFKDVVIICRQAGLVLLAHVAVDGTKVLANASKHSAMSYDRMVEEEQRLLSEIEGLLKQGQSEDEADDAKHGADHSGDELPSELAFRDKRLAKIRKAKAELEQEAKERAAAKQAARAQKEAEATASGKKLRGFEPKIDETPDGKTQRNFTDPDSRIMKNSDKAFVQAYNGQAAVDSGCQIIVACDLTNQAADAPHLKAMIDQVQANTGGTPGECSADTGYFSQENVKALEDRNIEAFIPPERLPHHEHPLPPTCVDPDIQSAADRQRAKLMTQEGRDKYALRKQTVEPVFGQTKFARGFRQFLLRGLENVRDEWALVCLAHNVLKLYRYGDRNLIFQN